MSEKEIKRYPLISTAEYLLVVDEKAEIKKGQYGIDAEGRLFVNNSAEGEDKMGLLILAHRPLNGSLPLPGVPLLPPIDEEAEKLADYEWKESQGQQPYKLGLHDGIIKGWNAHKVSHPFTKEDIMEAYKAGVNEYDNILRDGGNFRTKEGYLNSLPNFPSFFLTTGERETDGTMKGTYQ